MNKAGEMIVFLLMYISLFLSALAISIVMCAQISDLYFIVQERNLIFEGEQAEDRDGVRRMNCEITDFLSGKTERIVGASDRANKHMQDVKRLLDGVRTTAFVLILLSVVLSLKKRRLKPEKMLMISFVPVVIALASFAVFAFSDFTDLFIRFHEIAFSNDLWLLNPEEDLLIRCLPEGFFLEMAMISIALGLALYALMATVYVFFINKFGRRDF